LELLAVFLALLVLATPVLAISALWRQRKLRSRIEELAHQTSQQNDALHRELLELRRQIIAVSPAASPAPHPEASRPTVSVVASKLSQPVVGERVPEPALKEKPAQPITAPLSALAVKTDLILCPWCSTVHAGGVSNCPHAKPVTPAIETPSVELAVPPVTPRRVEVAAPTSISLELKKPVEDKSPEELAVSEQSAAAEVANTAPPVHGTSKASLQPLSPSSPTTPPKSAPPPQVALDQFASSRIAVESPASVRVVEPPQFATLRSTTPKATAQQRMKSVFALEETLGTNWLNKLGITILVLGLALFGIYELGQLGPAGKVGLSYFVSSALLAGGVFFERRERYRVLGHTLIGGGWALLFFTTYALNHVHAMRVMSSENTDLILMLAVALAMVGHTLRYRSQLVTGLAFLLAYSTVSLSHDDVYSLSSGVILAIGLVSIVIKMGWFELEVFGILSGYLNHLYWLYRLLGPAGAQGHLFPEYHASTTLLLFYWLIFRISYIVRKVKSPGAEHVSTLAALLNTLLLLVTMKFQSVQPELAFVALLIIGAAEFAFGQIPITKRRREAFIVLSVLGAGLMTTAVPFRYSGNNVAILWLTGGEALLVAGVLVSEVVFRRLGLFAGILVGLHLAAIDFRQLAAVRQRSEEIVLAAGVMFALCAVVFYLNVLRIGQRWRLLFVEFPDSPLLCGHSYLGAFAAVSAAWALCSQDWTAVAFAGIMLALAVLGQTFKSFHLQVQCGVIGALIGYRVVLVNIHSEAAPHIHISTRLITLPVMAAMFYVSAKFSQLRDDSNGRTFRGLFALAGTFLLTALIYYEVPELWQPVAAIVFAVSLLEVGQRIGYRALAWHAHLLSGLAVLAALTADPAGFLTWHQIPVRALGALPVVLGLYWIANRIALPNIDHVHRARIAYSWAGTGVMLWVLSEAVPLPWVAVSWIAFAIALALVMHRIGYRQLAWQANVVAACAVGRCYTTNFALAQTAWTGISLRLVTVSIVAGGLYFLSRKATIADSSTKPAITYLYTFAATASLAFLAWYEAPGPWLAAVWALFALILALIDRRLELDDLRWQGHALAVLATLRGVSLNLYIHESWHGISLRLLSLAVVTVVLYALAQLIRMPEDWRVRELHHIYSWAASALVSLLMWYELQPLSVAVGWAVFGVVLFEYGLLRKTKQFRLQAYLALSAAFGRIFFANLAAGNPGEFWAPRIFTVLPLTLIYFFVYAQLETDDRDTESDRRLHFDDLVCYLGTGSVVALLYFQIANDWLVTAWAAVAFVLFGVALLLDRSIFLHQGVLLTLGTCARGILHNLFGASYFSGGDWTGRYFVLASAVAVLLACLPFAFRLRERGKQQTLRFRWLAALVRHPEQFMFFAPVFLLTLMLALKMRAGMVTVAWGFEGVAIVLLALAANERSYRLTGPMLLLVCVAKIMVRDAWGLAPRDRYVTFIILGAALLLVSFLYSKYRETIRQFL